MRRGIRRTFEELLFQLSLGDLNLDRLVDLLSMSPFVIGVVLDGGGEESVDEGCLSETRLAGNLGSVSHGARTSYHFKPSYHNREGRSSLCDNLVTLIW